MPSILRTAAKAGLITVALSTLIGYGTSIALAAEDQLTLTVKMDNYRGERAYAAIYIVGPDDAYVSTLHVAGKKSKYQADLRRWNRLMKRSGRGIDGTTGASMGRNEVREMTVTLPSGILNAGYQLIAESAVEDQRNIQDLVMPLDDAHLGKEQQGSGYISTITLAK